MINSNTNSCGVIILSMIFLNSCNPLQTHSPQEQKEYYYKMNSEELDIFAAKVSKLNIGDSYQKVVAELGTPDSDRKMEGPKVAHNVLKREIVYRVKKWNKDLNFTNKDKSVLLYFNENADLVAIDSTEELIKSRGIP